MEQACATAQVSETVIRILHTEASKPSIEESKTVERVKVNTLHEAVSPDTVLKVAEHNSICPNEAKVSHPKDHIDDNRSRHDITEDAKLPAAKKDASETIANCKIEVDCSSSPSTIEPIRSRSGNTSVKANQTVENPTSNSGLGQMTPIQKDRYDSAALEYFLVKDIFCLQNRNVMSFSLELCCSGSRKEKFSNRRRRRIR